MTGISLYITHIFLPNHILFQSYHYQHHHYLLLFLLHSHHQKKIFSDHLQQIISLLSFSFSIFVLLKVYGDNNFYPNFRDSFFAHLIFIPRKKLFFKWIFIVPEYPILHCYFCSYPYTFYLNPINNLIFFRVIALIYMNFSIRKVFYFIFDKIGYHIYFNAF